ncbi:hypothetical protein LG047_12615 [Methylocystis sp. WRRC1]|uniref:hypothetical protein n=1 Tax=unclassified Methylocystis TaxID=2625913 RepID=UPI0001F86A87|nr:MULTISPECIES: hypothetical protein [unclassified Methylocystis]MCC3246152.1 hypothetical protein [Methylocystis sp. WRRC1]
MTPDTQRIVAEISENRRRLGSCVEHRFPSLEANWIAKYRCANCGGEADYSYIAAYCQGFKAAGGDPRDVCANIEGDA